MRLVGYVRVSTIEQVSDGLGLDIQAGAVRAFGVRSGARIVRIYRDPGISGATLERPGLASALDAIRRHRADGLVVSRLDRLARSLTIQEAILAQVWEHGGRVFTTEGGEVLRDDPDDPMRTAMRQMVGVFSELERGMIAARLRAGRTAKAANGGYAGGRPPYGFRAEGGALVPDFREQRILSRARALRASGESYRAIGRALESAGFYPRHGRHWDPGRLRRVLTP